MPRKYIHIFFLGAFLGSFGNAWTASAGSPGEGSFLNTLGMRMLPISAGQFSMGSATAEENRWDEAPVHEVRINDPFYISASEVTIEQFLKFRPQFSGALIEAPAITGVRWQDAVGFCAWLSQKEGKCYRLPTEAEWEYSARAGTDTPFWSGQEPPEPVLPNPWGLLGVHSGPAEWCLDWYGPYSYPFQWITSEDNGSSWSGVHFPQITTEVGPHTNQPINTVFRGQEGTLYVSTDGEKATTVLRASDDDGKTWRDTGGRTHGRHTTFAVLKDGRILGMGGKKSNIDGYICQNLFPAMEGRLGKRVNHPSPHSVAGNVRH